MFNFEFLFRKKSITNNSNESNANLPRVLGLIDVAAIGISCTLGSGIYVIAGSVITNYTGPSVILSFLIAGLTTLLSGLSYAELGARVPKSGSAYVYIYVTIGEFFAFMMGWDLILEYVIGTSSVASALSQYIDGLTGKKIQTALRSAIPFNSSFLGPYPDFLAFALVIVITVLMIIGVKESAFMNKLFTIVNIMVLSFIIVCGATKTNFSNWNIDVKNNLTWIDSHLVNQSCSNSKRCGNGGFMPFGFNGVISGAAKCFYAYIGFDAIASTGEELINPKRNIPLSIVITLSVVGTLYCGLSSVLTLMIPYYVLDSDTPLPHAFEYAQLDWAKYFVSIGAVLSLTTCLYSGMFPMPRIIYCMSSDGLLFKFLGKLLPKFQTPYVASIMTGLIAGIFALLFDLNELVDMLSIGTLMAYTLVSLCVLILRYRPVGIDNLNPKELKIVSELMDRSGDSFFKRLILPENKIPNLFSSFVVDLMTMLSVIDIVIICALLSNSNMKENSNIFILLILVFTVILMSFIIWRQPQVSNISTFKTPLVPFIPLLSTFINIYMMTTLTAVTWARFFIWFALGIVVYFIYGAKNSELNKRTGKESSFFPCFQRTRKIHAIKEKENTKF